MYRIGKNVTLTIPNVDKKAEIFTQFWWGRKIGTPSLERILATAKNCPPFNQKSNFQLYILETYARTEGDMNIICNSKDLEKAQYQVGTKVIAVWGHES